MHTVARFAARCAAGILVLAVMVGPVVAVFYAAGNPFTGDVLERLTDRRIDDATIIKLLSVLFYIAWAWFCAPALRQLARTKTTRPVATTATRAHRAPVAAPPQPPPAGARGALARLTRYAISGAATATLMAPSLSPLNTSAAAPTPTTVAATVDTPTATAATTETATAPTATTVVATHRDTPYAIARRIAPEHVDAVRDEIIELNLGRTMPDGSAWRGGALPAGWDVIVPATALVAAPVDAPAADIAALPQVAAGRHRVLHGESYWSISEGQLRVELGREPTDRETLERTNALMATNAERLGYADPAMLRTNDELDPALPATAPTDDVTAQPQVAAGRHRVVRGESYWSISEGQLRVELGREPTDRETLERTNALMATNAERLGYADPAMLHADDELDPARPADAPITDAAQQLPAADTAPPSESVEPEPAVTTDAAAPAAPGVEEAPAAANPAPQVTVPAPATTAPSPATTAPSAATDNDQVPAVAAQASPTQDARPTTPPPLDPASLPNSTTDISEDGPRFPIASTLGMASVAAGIIAVVEVRRRRRIRLHQPGHRPSAPPSPDHVRTELATRALAARSHLAQAATVASALAQCYRDGDLTGSALVQGIVVGDDGTATVHIDEPVPPNGPFTGVPGTWRVHTASLDPGDTMGSVDQLLRTIVSVGRTDDAEVFVDLESLGSVAVKGHRHLVTGIISGIVDQLVDRDDVEIHSDQPLLDRTTGHLAPAGAIDSDLLQRLAVERQPLWDQLDQGTFSSVIEARLADWPYEQLIPACVVTATDDVADVAAAAGGGGRGLAVIAPSAGAVNWHVSDGTLRLDHLDLVVTSPAMLDAASYQQLAELIESEPVHDDPGLVVVHNPPPAPAANAVPATEFSERDWTYMVRVLRREPDVIDPHGNVVEFVDARNRNGRRGPELIAYLASRADRRATVDLIREHLWWDEITANTTRPRGEQPRITSDQTVSSLVYRARAVIGKQDAIEHVDGWWRLDPRIVSDVELLADRLHFAQNHHAPWPVLRDGLSLIAGEPFSGSRSYEWASATGHLRILHDKVSDLAVLAARQAIDESRPDDALWVCDQALLANPINEIVLQEAFRIEASLNNLDGVRRRFQALTDQLRGVGEEPDPSTLDAYHALLQRRRSA